MGGPRRLDQAVSGTGRHRWPSRRTAARQPFRKGASLCRRPRKGQKGQALGVSRGGSRTKLHLRADAKPIRRLPGCQGAAAWPVVRQPDHGRAGLRHQCPPSADPLPGRSAKHSVRAEAALERLVQPLPLSRSRRHRAHGLPPHQETKFFGGGAGARKARKGGGLPQASEARVQCRRLGWWLRSEALFFSEASPPEPPVFFGAQVRLCYRHT